MKIIIENNTIKGSQLGNYNDFIIIEKYYDLDHENKIIIAEELETRNRVKLIVNNIPEDNETSIIEVLDYDFL